MSKGNFVLGRKYFVKVIKTKSPQGSSMFIIVQKGDVMLLFRITRAFYHIASSVTCIRKYRRQGLQQVFMWLIKDRFTVQIIFISCCRNSCYILWLWRVTQNGIKQKKLNNGTDRTNKEFESLSTIKDDYIFQIGLVCIWMTTDKITLSAFRFRDGQLI